MAALFSSFLRRSSPILLAFLLVVSCSESPEEGSGEQARARADTLKIGVILPISGALAPYGQSTLAGVQMKVDQINQAGGINGRAIEMILENNEGNTVKSAEALRKLVGLNKVLAVVGPITSTNSLAVTRDAQKKGVVLITPLGTNDTITKDGDFVFRGCFNDSFQGTAMARFAYEDRGLPVVVAFQDTSSDYSVGLCRSFVETFEQLGGRALPTLSYMTQDTDFTAQLRRIRNSEAQALFVPGYPPELPLIINQARNLGMEVTLLGSDGWDNQDVVTNAGKNLNGSFFSAMFSTQMASPGLDEFLKMAEERGIENPGSFQAQGFDSMGMVIEAIRVANPQSGTVEEQRVAVRDALANLKNYEGAGGVTTMRPSGDPIKDLVILQYVYKDGRVTKEYVKTLKAKTEE
ncbi:ABC transporter substrate-binding protein [bacterium]|nr:ABC transporter substrate-binding protein [bacterium]